MSQKSESPLRELCRGVYPAPDPSAEFERRARIGARMVELQRELTERGQKVRRLRIRLLLAALVATSCGIIFFVRSVAVPSAAETRLVAGHASWRAGGDLEPLAQGRFELPSDGVLVTDPREPAELRLSSDTAVDVAPASEVGLTRRRSGKNFEERVRLLAGSVALRVPKLGERGKVSVETGDALVEVHGTQFSVRVVPRPPLAPFTEVDVREGRVLVRSGASSRLLGAGDHWSSGAGEAVAPAAAAPAAPAPESIGATPGPPRARRPAAKSERAAAASELAAQNRLLESAELAQKSGMPGLALQRFDTLIARYPDAELAHNARVERFRILRAMDRKSDAMAAARAYLERYPDGFARAEATRLLESLSGTP
jgi:hypothetical protein